MIELGSDDGIWGHLFLLVLTWNLICRVNNESKICLCHMEWADNALQIYFANSKTDQQGAQSKFPMHVYSNPIDLVICPFFALGMYLAM